MHSKRASKIKNVDFNMVSTNWFLEFLLYATMIRLILMYCKQRKVFEPVRTFNLQTLRSASSKMTAISLANSFRLAPDILMPKVGLGTWKMTPSEVRSIVPAAIKCGYNLIDCASGYQNEKNIGEVLFSLLQSERVISRENLFITSKLANPDHSPHDVKPAVLRSLRDLRQEYLDLYLMHFPVSWPNKRKDENAYPGRYESEFYGKQSDITIFETWRAMEQLVDDGLVRSIGVSNG